MTSPSGESLSCSFAADQPKFATAKGLKFTRYTHSGRRFP